MKNKDGKNSGGNSPTDSQHADVEGCNFGLKPFELLYLWYPNQESVNHLEYIRRLECEFTCLQRAFLTLTTQFARLQFRIRQIVQAEPSERHDLLLELEHLAFNPDEEKDEMPPIKRDSLSMGEVRHKQHYILEQLRRQLCTLAEAQNWKPEPELNAEPPAPGSVDEVVCCCIRKKRKPPPPPLQPQQPQTPDMNDNAHVNNEESRYSSSSKNQTETEMGMGTDRDIETEPSRNSSAKQRVSISKEEALAFACNTDPSYSIRASTTRVSICPENDENAKQARPCTCRKMNQRQDR
ncbi:uncharacterized protein LOC105225253 [Bactrocera dorsalis]|uniref:Uncharacterized protein LOC105225253 n=1 Tax=Bactrocera dorsalis TaxID=27457 RepID=A0ABM3JXM2_BACDO|nr:uncharacterized protein LOC105225253 [Bactrocera dorsalis]